MDKIRRAQQTYNLPACKMHSLMDKPEADHKEEAVVVAAAAGEACNQLLPGRLCAISILVRYV